MRTASLSRLASLAWILACAMVGVLAFDMHRLDGARAAVWACALVEIVGALILSRWVRTRAEVAEQDAAEWRAKWGGEVGPYKVALTRLVWAIEEATPGSHGRPARVDAPDLLTRAGRLTRTARIDRSI